MRKLVEFQILDSNAVHYGINLFELMTNAGKVIADYIQNNYSQSEKIVFVCESTITLISEVLGILALRSIKPTLFN